MSIEINEFTNADFSKEYIINGLTAMPGGFFIYKADWKDERILYANQAILDLFECKDNDEFQKLTGGSFKGMVHPDDYDEVEASIKLQVGESEDNFDQVHYRIRTKTGKVLNIEDIARLYEDPVEGPLFYVFVSTFHSKVDPLTGLPNKEYFMKTARTECRKMHMQHKDMVIINFDLNGLKRFNSRYRMEEGDKLILCFADILKRHFDGHCCSRFGEDHFYAFAESADIEVILNQIIGELQSANNGRTLTVRIGIAGYTPDEAISEICDKAKIASDNLIDAMESDYVWFNEDIKDKHLSREYILRHFDQAIAEGWIEPFYQPVVRTLNGRVCGFEALARWKDPEYGILLPSEFITILEENHISYKLDMYIIGKVVEMLHRRKEYGQPVVPVSVNLAQSDFDLCDPVTIISSLCDSHGISRNLISIEIAETALMNDRGLIRNAINRFHKSGFEVWMDDFGEGYSSLNILKEFSFDGIKMDIDFLKDMNEKSRQIIIMAIRMAKSIGMHTLAEGVEKPEHCEFLKSIGCEKIQGYVYSKPLMFDEVLRHMSDSGLIFEPGEVYEFYQKAGLVDLVSPVPLALFLYDGRRFKTLFKNEPYSSEVKAIGVSDEQGIELYLNSDQTMLSRKFKELADKAIDNNKSESMIFVARNKYFRGVFTPVARMKNCTILSATIDGTRYDAQRRSEEMDRIMRNITTVYDNIYLIDYNKDSRTVITSTFSYEHDGDITYGLRQFYADYSRKRAHIDDIERLQKFLSKENIEDRFRRSDRGSFSEVFLVMQQDGNYHWTEFLFVGLPESDGQRYFVCEKPSEVEDAQNKTEYIRRLIESNNISLRDLELRRDNDWEKSLLENGNIKLFWKDKERRFVGASDAFLKYYGFKSLDEIIGKTDEDLAWHIDDNPYRIDEKHVIERGESVLNAPGKVIVEGVPRDILANKFPAYYEGKVTGLIGYFVDIEQDLKSDEKVRQNNLIDPLTGLLNAQGMMMTMLEFDSSFKTSGSDYVYASIFVDGYNEVLTDFGEEVAQHLIKLVARTVKKSFGSSATIARNYGCHFAVCEKGYSTDAITKEISRCTDAIKEIKEVEKHRCNISMTYGIAMGSEANNIQSIMDIAQKRQEISVRRKGKNFAFSNTEILPDINSDLPLPYVVLTPIMDEKNENVLDMRFLFVNQKYSEMTGIMKKDLLGKGYLETFPHTDHLWIEYTYRAVRGEYVHNRIYDAATRHWIKLTAAPSVVPGTCAVVYEVVDIEKRQENQAAIGRATLNEIIRLARMLDGEMEYENAINHAIEHIGNATGATKVYIYETDRKTFSNSFEWHADGSVYDRDKQQYRDYRYISMWEKRLDNDTSIIIENVELLKYDHPELFSYLKANDINWLISSPIYHKGQLIGYLGVDNYDYDKNIDIRKYIETAAYLLSARLKFHEFYEDERIRKEKQLTDNKEHLTGKLGYEILEILGRNVERSTVINEALTKLGDILRCDRIFVMEINDGIVKCSHEWCNKHVESMMKVRQGFTQEDYIGIIDDSLYVNSAVVIEDLEDVREFTPKKYELLKEYGVDHFIEVPFFDQGELIGILGVDNFYHTELVDTKKILETVAFFIGYKIIIERLRMVSVKDSLFKKSSVKKAIEDVSESDLMASGVSPNIYKDLPVPCLLIKACVNTDVMKADDFEFAFVNEAYCKLVNIPYRDLVGKKYCEVFHNADPQWVTDVFEAAVIGRTVRDRRYEVVSERWVDLIIAPTSIPGYCTAMLLNVDMDHNESKPGETKRPDNSNAEIVVATAEIFNKERDDDKAIKNVLEELSKYVYADHLYILLVDRNKTTFSERYEWCRDGVRSNLGMLQKIDRNYLQRSNAFRHSNHMCDDISIVKKSDIVLYEFLKARNIRNTIQIPLYRGEEIIGYFGADNIDENKEAEAEILKVVAYFVAAKIIMAKMDQ
ncbi:EAL domain-containing protein [Oribacterium sp. WCC10]|uniref:EAL domain-containing protein n=1 Tax=Oribacterium sp. WCC10 TaxID=1855343 RepID=UPI0008EBAA55|nr:EAL domain-containing protein [Oribacterium sp. WCC10]SFG79530.1 diguanylate cyclase (GGDEF) domain-containing protein [Oribacterium sp. WCC10]